MSEQLEEYIFYYIKNNINISDFGDIDYFYSKYISGMPYVETDDEAVYVISSLSNQNIEEIVNKSNLKGEFTPKMLVNRYWDVIGRDTLDNKLFMDYLFKYKRGIIVEYVLDCVIKRVLETNKMEVDVLFDRLKM